ncbi:MAG TPA: MFS transporter [Syntrophomonas sp.]|nr:MFS transporter [Syntrophomonas sp.]
MSPLLILGLFEFARNALVLVFLPLYGQYTAHFDLNVIGTAISLQYVSDNLFRLPSGWLADHLGGKRLIGAGIIISLTGLSVIFMIHSEVSLMLGSILFGLGIAPVWPTVVSGIAVSNPSNQIGEALSKVYIAWLTGAGLGPIILYYIMGRSGQMAFETLLGVLLFTMLVLLVVKMPRRRQSETQSGLNYLKELTAELWSVKIIFPGMFLQTTAIGILMPIIAIFAQSVIGLNSAQLAYYLIGIGTVLIGLLIPAGKLADRFGCKPVLIVGLIMAAAGMLFLPARRTVSHALMAGMIIGIGYAFIFPAWNSLMARVITPQKQGMMWAVFMCIEGLGTAAGSFIGGHMWTHCGYQVPFQISALVLAIMAIFYVTGNVDRLLKPH